MNFFSKPTNSEILSTSKNAQVRRTQAGKKQNVTVKKKKKKTLVKCFIKRDIAHYWPGMPITACSFVFAHPGD